MGTASHIYSDDGQGDGRMVLCIKNILKKIVVPIVRLYTSHRTFMFNNTVFHYFIHGYNTTWINERAVEVPIVTSYLQKNERILEVGNVLSHYLDLDWDVLDKFEKGTGIINADIVDFKPKKLYDLIISVSTLEHIGVDDDEKDEGKIVPAILNMKDHCLAAGGRMIATFPIGYNKGMDNRLFSGQLFFNEIFFLKRVSMKNEWREVRRDEVVDAQYGRPFPGTNCLCIGILKK